MRLLLPACLALMIVTVSVVGGGCLTSAVISSAKESTQTEQWASLRVVRCYMNASRELVVLAEGGAVTGGNLNAVSREKITVAVKLDKLPDMAKSLRDAAWVLPLSAVQKGWPDAKFLTDGGFKEASFTEKTDGGAPSTRSVAEADRFWTGGAGLPIQVVYKQMTPTAAFTGGLGFAPTFIIPAQTGGREAAFVIADIKTTRHTGRLLLLPLSVPADVILIPIVVVAVIVAAPFQ